jgi:5-methylcytosine-specific restriction protein A
MEYIVNIADIEAAILHRHGEAKAKQIQDDILELHCGGMIPENYQHEKSFRQTIQRKIEDYCPQAEGFDPSKKEGKFIRVGHGIYRLAAGHNAKEFPAIEELPEEQNFFEGATKVITVNSYERNANARSKCISHYGSKCIICGFDFEEAYGEIGKSFIHVHHIIPLSEVKSTYKVDPINDLRPVCANCHAMIHRALPALSIDEVRSALKRNATP